jgi:F-type H+-transporting ATPase subunit a
MLQISESRIRRAQAAVCGIALALPLIVHANTGDFGGTLMHHVSDSRVWHPLPFVGSITLHDIVLGPVVIPITRYVAVLWIVAGLVAAVMIAAFGRRRAAPSRLAIAVEPVLLFVRDGLVLPTMGKEMGERWLPFFYTLFLFILGANLLGLVPAFPTVTGNIAVSGALALMVFVAVVVQGMRRNGFFGFFGAMVPEGIPWPIGALLLVIETAGLVIRNTVLAVRLFANMVAGHFVIVSLMLLIVLIHPIAAVVSVPMALFMDLLEVLVAVIQAVVFTMLSAIFIAMASTHH